MIYHVPNEFRTYRFLKTLFISLILAIILFLTFLFDFNYYVKLVVAIICAVITFIAIIYYMFFVRFKKYSYIEFTNIDFKYNVTDSFLLGFKEIIIPNKNILSYDITQGILLRKFNLYKLSLSSGSITINFHVDENNVETFIEKINFHIQNNVSLTERGEEDE